MLVSESQEIAMGRDYDRQVVASIGLYPDSALQRYIQQYPQNLLNAAGSQILRGTTAPAPVPPPPPR